MHHALEMKKPIIVLIVIVLSLVSVYAWTNRPRTVSYEKTERIRDLLRTVVADTLEKEYKGHNIQITARVTKIEVDRITSEETREYIIYSTRGRVSYIIQGRRDWLDKEGNRIRLGPETEITHMFTCGVREDRYGDLSYDRGRRLAFYADEAIP